MASDDDTAPDPIGRDLLSTALSTMQPDQATITAHDTLTSLFGNMGPLDPNGPVTAPPAIDPNQPGMGLPAPGRDVPPTLYAKVPPAELSPYTPPTADAVSGAGPRITTPADAPDTAPAAAAVPRATVGLLDLPHPKTIAEAEQQQAMLAQSSTNAALDAADAKAAAQHEHDVANQTALQKRNDDLATADDLRAKALEAGRQAAARDTAQLMMKLDKAIADKPDPANYFSGDGGTQRRVGWIMAVAVTAFANRRTGQANQALAMMEHAIDQDVALQKDQQALKIKQIGLERDDLKDRIKSDQLVIEDDYTHKIARLMSVAQMAQAKANAASSADLKAAHAGIVSWAQNEAVKVGAERTAHAATASEGAANRAHASAEARINRDFQREQANTAFQHDITKKVIDEAFTAGKEERKASLAISEAKQKKLDEQDVESVPIDIASSGISIVGGKAPRQMTVRKEQNTGDAAATKQVVLYGQIGNLYNRLQKHIDNMDSPDRDIATGASQEFIADATKLGALYNLKITGKSSTEQEFIRNLRTMVGQIGGVTPYGSIGFTALRGNLSQTRALIERNKENLIGEAEHDLATQFAGVNHLQPGERIAFQIPQIDALKSTPPTAEAQARSAGADVSKRPSGVELAKLPPQVSFDMLEHATEQGSLPPLSAKASAALDSFRTTLLNPKVKSDAPVDEGAVMPPAWLAKAGRKQIDIDVAATPKAEQADVEARENIILKKAEILAKQRSEKTIEDYVKSHGPGSTLHLGDLETWAEKDGLRVNSRESPELGWADLVEAATKALEDRDAKIRGR